jgi:hypothetical protein
MNSFIASTFATIVGGIGLAFLFFITKEKIFPIIDISDHWELTTTTHKTKRNPYKNMKIKYDLILWQENNIIRGVSEKYYELSQLGTKTYHEKNRKRGKMHGFVEKNYFSKDVIVLNMCLADFGRESDYLFKLKVINKDLAQGSFYSMVAQQYGHVELTRRSKC